MQVRSKAQESLVAQTKQEQQSLSGVNLDEEAANLIRYQQAYQASGKAIQIAASLFATCCNLADRRYHENQHQFNLRSRILSIQSQQAMFLRRCSKCLPADACSRRAMTRLPQHGAGCDTIAFDQ